MRKSRRIAIFAFMAGLLLSFSPVWAGMLLAQLDRFKAPPYPASQYVDRETYDYRIQSGRPNPKTLQDTFVCDLVINLKRANVQLEENSLTRSQAVQALDIYMKTEWRHVAGYRPWTHWNWIRRMTPQQRAALADEVVAYVQAYGVRDVVSE